MLNDEFLPSLSSPSVDVSADPCTDTGQDAPDLGVLVQEIIGRVADKWTMLVLEEQGTLRFTRLGELVSGVSQKMLTNTLRQMEQGGLLTRKVFPVILPRVEYTLTDLGLGAAFCGVWEWAETHILQARLEFRASRGHGSELNHG